MLIAGWVVFCHALGRMRAEGQCVQDVAVQVGRSGGLTTLLTSPPKLRNCSSTSFHASACTNTSRFCSSVREEEESEAAVRGGEEEDATHRDCVFCRAVL